MLESVHLSGHAVLARQTSSPRGCRRDFMRQFSRVPRWSRWTASFMNQWCVVALTSFRATPLSYLGPNGTMVGVSHSGGRSRMKYWTWLGRLDDLLKLHSKRRLLHIESLSLSKKILLKACSVFIWQSVQTFMHTTSVYWVGVIFHNCLRFCIFIWARQWRRWLRISQRDG